ncbi:hypothetical protein KSF_054260 [Reticulibacter mediterranei]|uniref:Uncharacterized protein n=1 Tax=Reticulibacter mediterranei TaxID=2778369 RepID=A0A8J3N4D6_9CHLR|nr:hypothetical protein [Reticulibacter mediterranei]GHO95378.1 hypothetical protein KSF_054260 [Reticulibacter mediterranei]
MKHIEVQDTYELPVSSQREFPAHPFPSKYVHCVINDLQYMVQAVYMLRNAGFHASNIHVMASWDFIEAAEQKSRQQNRFAKMLTRFLSFMDDAFGDIYLHEARKGNHVLMIRLTDDRRIGHIYAILTAHYASCIKYVDSWTVIDLAPVSAILPA